jgi:hypothetical protein
MVPAGARALVLAATLHLSSAYIYSLPQPVRLGAGSNADARTRLPFDLTLVGVGFTRVKPAFLLQMQEGGRGEGTRFSRGFRGGQQRRGRGGRRRGGRGGFSGGGDNFEGRSIGGGDGGGMSTDYVRGGMLDATALLDERMERYFEV